MKVYGFFSDSYFKNKVGKLHLVVRQRSNPRTEEYMRALFAQYFPHGEFTTHISDLKQEQVVLLYPDAIGLGFSKFENLAFGSSKPVRVINGRGRFFTLTPSTRRRLRLKRFLESSFLPEIILTPFLAVIAVFLTIFDFAKGRA